VSGPYVAVVGGGEVDDDLVETAAAVGRGLAEHGAVVVTGGLGELASAVCRGAAAAGGTSVAVLPGLDRREAPAEATAVLTTGLGEARNALVVRSADVVVAVGGGFGTLSEMALAVRAGTPVVAYRSWQLRPPHVETADDPVLPADSADAAVAMAIALAEA
jgi:uncharacterized protein (TIGR00725 family)